MTTGAVDASLARDIDTLAVPGLLIGHRVIAPGDEDALLQEEAVSIASPISAVRRPSGAARVVARALMARLGYPGAAVPKGASGEPIWPAGIIGSMAHDDRIAVAAAGLQRDIRAVGIDIEPALPLPMDMLELVATPQELSGIAADPLQGRLLFSAKEAVYKAVFPLDRVFLEFRDIEIDLGRSKATTRAGRILALRYCVSSHIVVVALS